MSDFISKPDPPHQRVSDVCNQSPLKWTWKFLLQVKYPPSDRSSYLCSFHYRYKQVHYVPITLNPSLFKARCCLVSTQQEERGGSIFGVWVSICGSMDMLLHRYSRSSEDESHSLSVTCTLATPWGDTRHSEISQQLQWNNGTVTLCAL